MSVKIQGSKLIQPYWSTKKFALGAQQGDIAYFQDVLGQTVGASALTLLETNMTLNGQFPKGRNALVYGISQYFYALDDSGAQILYADKMNILERSVLQVLINQVKQIEIPLNLVPEFMNAKVTTTDSDKTFSQLNSQKAFFMFNIPLAISAQEKFEIKLNIPTSITLVGAVNHKLIIWTKENLS